jgi:hypothetical protein
MSNDVYGATVILAQVSILLNGSFLWPNFRSSLETSPSHSRRLRAPLSTPVELYLLRTWMWRFERIERG